MNAKLILNLVLIMITLKLMPVIVSNTGSLLQYQDYVIAGVISLLMMPFVKPLFE